MKNLSIFKNDNKTSENAPDYRLVASYKDGEGNWQNQTVASLWKGDKSKENGPVLSGKMSEARQHEGKNYPGYSIKPDASAPVADTAIPPDTAPQSGEVNPEDIPF